jgi:hypothetical protein
MAEHEEEQVDERDSNALEAVVGWLDAMRRGDL